MARPDVTDPRIQRLAELIVDYSIAVRPDELVTIEACSIAAPLVRELYRGVLRAGGHPQVRIELDGEREAKLMLGSDAHLDWLNPRRVDDNELMDALIHVLGGWNTRELDGVDASRLARLTRTARPIADRRTERTELGELRWVGTAYPTQASAQESRMSLSRYAQLVYAACFVDRDDPVGEWRALGASLGRLAEWLSSRRELRIVAPGTDLRFAVEGRTWVPSDGRFNMPDGEVFTGPIEDTVEGEIAFSFPAIHARRVVEDVRLRFAGGSVIDATARVGQDYLDHALSVDEGARRVGEVAFGLNDAVQVFMGEPLFDEKIGGTMHLALGSSYPETGGQNQSALHWDIVCDLRRGGEVYADGELVYTDGRFSPSAGFSR
jgi:aminopeptidase